MAGRNSTTLIPERDTNENLQRHGSIRKVLHSLVGNDSLLGISARMLDRPKQYKIEDDLNPYQEFFREYALLSEYNILCQHLIPGLYIVPSARCGLEWFGVLFIRSGIYKGGIFRFTLRISENFPDSTTPRVIFENKIFHPCINEDTQEINLLKVFPEWSRQENHLWQVLDYACSIFYRITYENVENNFAAQLYATNIEEYKDLVQKCIEESKHNIFNRTANEDAHYFRFQEYNEITHFEARRTLKSPQRKVKRVTNFGLSWIKEGCLKPCSVIPFS